MKNVNLKLRDLIEIECLTKAILAEGSLSKKKKMFAMMIHSKFYVFFLNQVTRECLDKAISICAPGVEIKQIGRTIQYVNEKLYHWIYICACFFSSLLFYGADS